MGNSLRHWSVFYCGEPKESRLLTLIFSCIFNPIESKTCKPFSSDWLLLLTVNGQLKKPRLVLPNSPKWLATFSKQISTKIQ